MHHILPIKVCARELGYIPRGLRGQAFCTQLKLVPYSFLTSFLAQRSLHLILCLLPSSKSAEHTARVVVGVGVKKNLPPSPLFHAAFKNRLKHLMLFYAQSRTVSKPIKVKENI